MNRYKHSSNMFNVMTNLDTNHIKGHIFSLITILKCNIIKEFRCFILRIIKMAGGGGGLAIAV